MFLQIGAPTRSAETCPEESRRNLSISDRTKKEHSRTKVRITVRELKYKSFAGLFMCKFVLSEFRDVLLLISSGVENTHRMHGMNISNIIWDQKELDSSISCGVFSSSRQDELRTNFYTIRNNGSLMVINFKRAILTVNCSLEIKNKTKNKLGCSFTKHVLKEPENK